MNKNLNDIYYILRQDCSFDDFSVDSTESESHVDYDYDEIICGSNPVHFKLEMEDLGDLVEEHIFLYDGPSFLVNTKLKEIINYGLYQCQFYPAIIIDEIGNSRKDFWVLNTFGMLDALDDKESNISSSDDDSSVVGLIIKNRVLRYSLDEKNYH